VRACARAQIPSRGASTQQTTQLQRTPRTPQQRSCRTAQRSPASPQLQHESCRLDQSCQILRHGAVPKELPRSLKILAKRGSQQTTQRQRILLQCNTDEARTRTSWEGEDALQWGGMDYYCTNILWPSSGCRACWQQERAKRRNNSRCRMLVRVHACARTQRCEV